LNNTNLGYIYVALSAFFFAVMSIIGKCAFNTGIQVYDLLIMQNAVSFVVMFIYLWINDKKSIMLTRVQLKNVIIQGVFGSTATTILYYLALERITAGITAMLIFIHPIFVTLFFIITKTRKITWVNNLALILAVIGSAMVINVFNLDLVKTPVLGLVFGIAGSVTYAFYNIFADLRLKDINPEVMPLYTSAIMLVISAIINPEFFRFTIALTPGTIFYVLELAIISGILPVVFIYKGLALVGSEKVTIIATAELPITLIMAFVILRETMVYTQVMGVVFIIGAILVLQNESIIMRRLKVQESL